MYYFTNTLSYQIAISMVEIKNLSFRYSRKREPVFSDLSLNIGRGGVYGLLGRNGVGKTTLFYLIAGALTPCRGEITLDGIITRRRQPSTLEQIIVVPEETSLPSMTLGEWTDQRSYFYPNFSRELFEHICREFELTRDMRLKSLSTGVKKKASIALALACRTPLLMLDEPTNGLDLPSKTSFRKILSECADDEHTILIATHQIHDVERLLSHVIILDEKGVVMSQSISGIMSTLRFDVSNSPEIIASALWNQSGVGGNEVVTLLSDPADETEVDLEMLFNYMSTRPDNNPFL